MRTSAGCGYAEEVVVDEASSRRSGGPRFHGRRFVRLVYATAYSAQGRRGDQGGRDAVRVGRRRVGLRRVELGKLFGARVIACASSDDKLETCKRFGAEFTINYERDDLREALKNLGLPSTSPWIGRRKVFRACRARDGLERTLPRGRLRLGRDPEDPAQT